jgi:hypothetical protein
MITHNSGHRSLAKERIEWPVLFCYLDIPAHLSFNRWDKPPLTVLTEHDEQA